MTLRLRDLLVNNFAQLRYEPTAKWIRATLDGDTVVDSKRAILVWEPKQVVPYYAVPADDVHATLVVGAPVAGAESPVVPSAADAGRVPLARPGGHTVEGQVLSVRVGNLNRPKAAFRFADPGLAGYVGLDFDAFDAWYEEDEEIVGHPRDPFHRVDIRRSSRHVRIELDGLVIAESRRPLLLFETNMPVRFYLPPEDINRNLLRSSPRHTACAYKGRASYWSLDLDGQTVDDVAWSYNEPLPEAAAIAGMVAFFDERVDVVLDGQRRERPRTPWSAPSR